MNNLDKDRLVSVIIPTYKQDGGLEKTVKSVLNQTYINFEIIVVDDNDPKSEYRENTERLMLDFMKEDKRIHYIKHDKNRNGSAARNTGIRNSNGQYLMFLDDDDEFYSDKIEKQINQIVNLDESYGGSYSKYERYKKNVLYDTSGESRQGNLLTEQLSRNLFVQAGSNLLIKKSVIDKIGFFDESFNRNQDIEFMVRFFKKYKLAYCNVLGLRINIISKPSIENGLLTTKQYYEKFHNDIDNHPNKEYIIKHLILQSSRYMFRQKSFMRGLKLLKENNISFYLFIRYLKFLISRKLYKQCKGFIIEKS